MSLLAAGAAWYRMREAERPPQFRTAKVVRGPLTATVSATGTLGAVVSVQVGSQVSGQVREVLVDFNAEVRKGDLIARIDPETFEYRVRQSQADLDAARAQVLTAQANTGASRAAVSRAEVNLAEARRDLDRKRTLVERGFVSPAEAEKAEAVHAAAVEDARSTRAELAVVEAQVRSAEAVVRQREAQLQQARIDLERTAIRAPVDGIVIRRSIDAGQTVAASLQAPEMFVIAQDLRQMQVEASIDEAEIGRIRPGQKATFTVDAFPGRGFEGAVLQVRKAALTVQNVVTYVVVVSAFNPDLALVPGMTANVRIATDSRASVLKVPNAALRFRPPGFQEAPRAAAPGFAPTVAAEPQDPGLPSGVTRALQAAAALLPDARAQAASPLQQFREAIDREVAPDDAQKARLDEVFTSMRARFAGVRELPAEERARAVERLRAELRERIGEVFDPERRQRYRQWLTSIDAQRAGGSPPAAAGAPAASEAATTPAVPAAASKPGTEPRAGTTTPASPSPGSGTVLPSPAASATAPTTAATAPPDGPSPGGTTTGAAASGPGAQLRLFRERLIRDLALSESQRQQLDAIFGGLRERFVALRDLPEAERPKAAERIRADLRERIGEILTAEQKPRYAAILAEISGRQATRGRVFVLAPDGRPRAIEVRLGLSDGTFTEVSGDGLDEGTEVLVGVVSATRDAPRPAGVVAPRPLF